MRRMALATALVFTMLLSGTAIAAVRSEKVLGGPRNQYWPSSNGEHLAFSEYRRPIEAASPHGSEARAERGSTPMAWKPRSAR